ncbi:helicase C-terminal domain-containing protein [Frankia sp. Cj3]|uniref:helicase C-terminal domain-containing protein n=1 Tax=Frankia sp. Cj3 TaxID=2880976 RepID=UPI001EF3FC71|nr:helicase C-terminal domain-containing protein [Frankia sp. Cj3]
MTTLDGREQWIVWCGTNDEQDAITAALGDDCVSIYGRMTPEKKVELEARWREGHVRVLVSKPSIFGWGVNWQNCARMIFVGLGDSYESYYQCIRRCHRFGQTDQVEAHIVLSEIESAIAANVARKECEAERMTAQLVAAMRETWLTEEAVVV